MKTRFQSLTTLIISLVFFTSCNFFSSLKATPTIKLSFDKSSTVIKTCQVDVINLTVSDNQNNASVTWSFDDNIISATTDNYSAIITGLSAGVTTIKATCGETSVSCSVTVTNEIYQAVSTTNPYVYASEDVVSITPGATHKINASLFGGTNADINGFVWSIDKPSVASISTEGNYCWITGISDGSAKITVRHNKASYPYSVLVNCTVDGAESTYLTTTSNVITMNLEDSPTFNFSVSIVNPVSSDSSSSLSYSVVGLDGQILSNPPVSISTADTIFSLTAKSKGECYVRITHPSCTYPLDVFVRVLEDAVLAYIEPSATFLTLSGEDTDTVSLSVPGLTEPASPSSFTWLFSQNASYYLDYTIFNGDGVRTGDRAVFKGKKPGSVRATVSYPGLDSRDIVIIIKDIAATAADAQCYITSERNFYSIPEDDESFSVYIDMHNSEGDSSDFVWSVTDMPSDGSNSDVISIVPDKGIKKKGGNRSALVNTVSAFAVVTPLNPGTAYIDISHPDALYPTRITVIVKEKKVETEYCDLTYGTNPVIHLINGESFDASIILSGNMSPDETLITWSASGPVSLASSGTSCVITAPATGSGSSTSMVKVSHPSVPYDRTLTVYCEDSEECFTYEEGVKYIFTNQPNLTVSQSDVSDIILPLSVSGFTEDDFSHISWNVVSGDSFITWEVSENTNFHFTPVSAGSVIVTASHPSCPDTVYFTVVIRPEEAAPVPEAAYLTTSESVFWFSSVNETKTFSVTLNDSFYVNYSDTVFDLSNDDFEYTADSNYVTVRSLKESSEATLTVSHPLSQNTLTIYLKTGERYVYQNEDVTYISVDKDVFNVMPGEKNVLLTSCLMHSSLPDIEYNGFSYKSSDPSIAEVSFVNNSNICTIVPKKNGIACITVSNSACSFTKDVIVVVNPDKSAETPYLTSESNIMTLLKGDSSMMRVEVMNAPPSSSDAWHYVVSDASVVNVITASSGTFMIRGMGSGTAKITVTHDTCEFPLELIITVLDSSAVKEKPYITASSSIITLQKGSSSSFNVNLLGNDSPDNASYFRFSNSNSAIVLLDSAGATANLRALNTGTAIITVSNTLFSDCYSKSVLVIVEDSAEDSIYIKPSETVIKMSPTDGIKKITAELVNGNAADYDDFIFWSDDVSLITLSNVSNQCSIMPTGSSGTTKIHIKHRKAAKQADILVLVSEYDTFAFNSDVVRVEEGKFAFVPLEVPSLEQSCTVRYTSSDEDICFVQGSSSVAWVCGVNPGSATVTAEMVSSSNEVLATAELLVSVTVYDFTLPEINLGSPVVNAKTGDTRVFSATITGAGSVGETYNLTWKFKNNPKGVDIVNGSVSSGAVGPECNVTFNEPGQYVLVCTHSSGASAEVIIDCKKKGDLSIELDSYLETISLDDGYFELNVTVNNGSSEDEKNIRWSAIKPGGKSIVSVSKTNGTNAVVVPKATGTTTVIANLPGCEPVTCTVVVKSAAELVLETENVHIIPGYSETVRYHTVPEGATINWYTQMSGASFSSNETYFTVSDNPVTQELTITAQKEYQGMIAGTITGIMSGASSKFPVLNVYCEYDLTLELYDSAKNPLTNLTTAVDGTKKNKLDPVSFIISYYPANLDIDLINDDKVVYCFSGTSSHTVSSMSNGITIGNTVKTTETSSSGFEMGKISVTLVPGKEVSTSFKVRASIPSATSSNTKTQKEQSFTCKVYYSKYNIELKAVDSSSYDSGVISEDGNGNVKNINLTEGEPVSFSAHITNEGALGTIDSLSIVNNPSSNSISIEDSTTESLSQGYKIFTLEMKDDADNNSYDTNKKGPVLSSLYTSGNSSSPFDSFYLVTKEPYITVNNTKYYLIPHSDKDKFSVTVEPVIYSAETYYDKWANGEKVKPIDDFLNKNYKETFSNEAAHLSYFDDPEYGTYTSSNIFNNGGRYTLSLNFHIESNGSTRDVNKQYVDFSFSTYYQYIYKGNYILNSGAIDSYYNYLKTYVHSDNYNQEYVDYEENHQSYGLRDYLISEALLYNEDSGLCLSPDGNHFTEFSRIGYIINLYVNSGKTLVKRLEIEPWSGTVNSEEYNVSLSLSDIQFETCEPYIITGTELKNLSVLNLTFPDKTITSLYSSFKKGSTKWYESSSTITSKNNSFPQVNIEAYFKWVILWIHESNATYTRTINLPYVIFTDFSFLTLFYNPSDSSSTVGSNVKLQLKTSHPSFASGTETNSVSITCKTYSNEYLSGYEHAKWSSYPSGNFTRWKLSY